MSKSIKGDPYFIGHIVSVPPGMVMPPVTGFTPFWEKEMGLLYIINKDARRVNLSIGSKVRFEIQKAAVPRNMSVDAGQASNTNTIVTNISNV